MNPAYDSYFCPLCVITYPASDMTHSDTGPCIMTRELKARLVAAGADAGWLGLVKDGGSFVGYLCRKCKTILFGLQASAELN